MKRLSFFLAFILAVILAGGVWAASVVSSAALPANDTLKQSIQHDLREADITGVEVTVDGSTVDLAGEVDSLWERRRAEELALDNRDVESVNNQLTIGSSPGDEALARDIARRLSNYVHYSIFDDVNVQVNDGVATLTGKVTWGFKAKELSNMAARVGGVEEVVNQIDVLPSSANDQQLRHALATQIYGDPLFTRYSIQPTPPIHIVVENGRVTLTGQVNSEIERRKAAIIARGTFGVFSVDNQLVVSSS